MNNYLVIVESPAKSKTIEKYLGEKYTVMSSKGHIRDLTTRGYGGYGVDIENGFTPQYKIMKDKKTIVKELKEAAKKCSKVYLATDPDREGEAISWHLYEALGLTSETYVRIVFNEVTKPAVLNAIKNGRDIDMDLVHSQESRRIIDRIIGFSLSKLLQKKIGSKSAGRVQSIALKFIVDREKEIDAFDPVEYWEIYLQFTKDKKEINCQLIAHNDTKLEIKNKAEADKILSELGPDNKIQKIEYKEKQRKAKLPFTTSTLQQTASSRCNFKAKKTMQIAQKLYEGIDIGKNRVGLITYMRTDSVRLSSEFINGAKDYIIKNFGEKYYKGYSTTNSNDKNVQDAHEAIRPSNVAKSPKDVKEYLTKDEYKLYSLIYNRAVGALMSNAQTMEEKVTIENNGYQFNLTGTKLLFDGFLKVLGKQEKEKDNILPDLVEGEILENTKVLPEQKFTTPPHRYSEASLIKKMEEMGIGRPSTYAVTMETLKYRNYAKLQNKAFFATKQGILTSEKLDEYFKEIINVKYTAEMENALDKISEGNMVWNDEVKDFYSAFKPLLENADEKMIRMYPKETDKICPKCGSPLVIRNGRFGEFIACSAFPKCHYTAPQNPEDVPKPTGLKCPNCEEGMIVERISKKGKHKGEKFYACDQYPKCKTVYTTLDEAKADIEKHKEDAKIDIKITKEETK